MLVNDHAEFREILYHIDSVLRSLCQKANLPPPPPLCRRIPQAPPLYDSPATNPSTASIDSNASSNSSTTYQFNALSMNSPSGANPQPQVAGPSRLGQASSPQEGKSFTHSQTSKAVLSIMRTLQTLE